MLNDLSWVREPGAMKALAGTQHSLKLPSPTISRNCSCDMFAMDLSTDSSVRAESTSSRSHVTAGKYCAINDRLYSLHSLLLLLMMMMMR
jgi:hypothetical protein